MTKPYPGENRNNYRTVKDVRYDLIILTWVA